MTTETAYRQVRRAAGGPPLWGPALGYALTTIAAAALFAGARTGAPPAATLAAQQASPTLGLWSGLLLFASAMPLAVWAAAACQQLRHVGLQVAGPTIGLAGGVLACAALALSGLVSATASAVAPSATPATAATLGLLAFNLGAAGFAVPFGLLLAGIAVPSLIRRLIPAWLAAIGLVLAALGVLTVLTVAVPAVSPLLPVVRFGGLLWLLAVSLVLPRHRADR